MSRTTTIVPSAPNGTGDPSPPAPPDRLDPSDLAFHAHVLAQVKTLPEIQGQIHALQERAVAIDGSKKFWIDYLGTKYGLAEGDQVLPDGSLVRAPAANGTG